VESPRRLDHLRQARARGAGQDISAARGPVPANDPATPERRRYLLAGLLACGTCGRRMESAWSNGRPAYRCHHGHTTASAPSLERPRNAYIREDVIVAHLPAPYLLLTGPAGGPRRQRTRGGTDVRHQPAEHVIAYLRERQITLTYDPADATLRARTGEAAQTITLKAS
jgi:site-specific DNA recombinase